MNSKQPEIITGSLDGNGTATVSIQIAPNVKIVLAVSNGAFVIGKIVDSSPAVPTLDDDQFKKMLDDERHEYESEVEAGLERKRRRALGLEP